MSEAADFILCPYCFEPLEKRTEARRLAEYRKGPGRGKPVACDHCTGDVTRDAPFEAPPQVFFDTARKPCVHCAHLLLELAVRCGACKKWLVPETAEQRADNAKVSGRA